MSKIFISVASYQDPLLWWTVKDCYKKAKHPENLVFGIVDQGTFPAYRHLGFIFTLGRFCHDIPYDPLLYFYGEEQNICVRAFTSGYDIYHPVKIPMRHFYIRKSSSKHWLQEEDALRSVPWWEREARSKQRLCDLLYLQKDLGIYGLGKERTLEDFARYSGIDYVHRLIAPTKNVPPWPDAT